MQTASFAIAPSERASIYAGFWSRALAKLIDGVLVSVCLLPLDLAFRTSLVIGVGSSKRPTVEEAIAFAVFCLYSAITESSTRQATIGKRAVGIIVSDVNGNRISFGRALMRAALQFTMIDYLVALFTSRKQALHDLLAGTQVPIGSL
jgi:uncharacterized RDD family membrane protein YckC